MTLLGCSSEVVVTSAGARHLGYKVTASVGRSDQPVDVQARSRTVFW